METTCAFSPTAAATRFHIDVPVVVDKGAAKVDVASVILGALRSAVVGAIASPLKIVGMVAAIGSCSGAIEPQLVSVLAGRIEPTPEGLEQIGQLANLLASRPAIGLNLAGQVGESDVRWLREQALRAKLEAGPGHPRRCHRAPEAKCPKAHPPGARRSQRRQARRSVSGRCCADGRVAENRSRTRPPTKSAASHASERSGCRRCSAMSTASMSVGYASRAPESVTVSGAPPCVSVAVGLPST